MNKPERRCPVCAKPIELQLSFCKQHWFELPVTLRDNVTTAMKNKNFLAKVNAVSAGLQWFTDKRLHLIK